jgi:hypothetical protein
MTILEGKLMPEQLNAIAACEPVRKARRNKGRVDRRIATSSVLSRYPLQRDPGAAICHRWTTV